MPSPASPTHGSARPVPGAPPPSPSRRDLLTLRKGGPDVSGHWIRLHRAAMACRFEVLIDARDVPHADAAREALDEVDRLEAQLSVFRDTSEVSRLNRTAGLGPAPVGAELHALLRVCAELHEASEGAFDVTSTPLSRCWGFLRREGRLPAAAEIAAAREVVGMGRVGLGVARPTVRFERAGMELNLGSIGKGWALDRMADLLRARGVRQALVSSGGSSAVALGGGAAGWTIDVRSRQAGPEPLFRLALTDGAMATSGAGEQFFVVDGRRYGHVIDPRTGWPARGVLSVTVVAREAARCDALSTAFFIGGLDLARRYCASHPDTLVLLVPDDGQRRVTALGTYLGARFAATEHGSDVGEG